MDNSSRKWIDFHIAELVLSVYGYKVAYYNAPIYVNSTNLGILRSRGTIYGIAGYDGTYYYIVGWNKTKNYTDNLGIDHGIYIYDNGTHSFKIYNVKSTKSGYGISVGNTYTIEINKSVVEDNKYTGIWVYYNGGKSINHCTVYNNYDGIKVQGDSSSAFIYENRVYRNTAAGIKLESVSGSLLGVSVFQNYVFGNDVGLYGSSVADASIDNNGFSWNTHYGVELHTSNGNYIYNNTFYYNNGTTDHYDPHKIQAYDNGNNYWNNTKGYGNYWHDWVLNNDTNDQDPPPYGDVEWPYHIDGGNRQDNYPFIWRDHDPIRIDSVGDLDWNHGYVGGDGTSSYPYLIVDWNIYGAGAGYGLYVGNISDEFRIDHCIVTGTSGGSGNVYYSNSGIIIYNAKNWRMHILNSYSYGNDNSGLDIHYSTGVYVYYSYFQGNHEDGVYAYGSNGIDVEYTNMSNNDNDVFKAGNCDNINLKYNIFYKNGGDGVWMYSNTNDLDEYGYIYNNTFKNNTGYGVYLSSCSEFLIYHNIFYKDNGASADGQQNPDHIQAYDDESTEYTNWWNTSTEGNCWSDWNQGTPYQIDPGPNYVARDHQPTCGFVPEFNSIFIAVFLVALIGMVIQRKIKQKH